ncbi:hypothetical protein ACF1A5_26330 [Streptomyces sp. NPDC014864]|uniref:hypothetical protein n=1 Tax=Streptomyces sp. NPDC014864 TaxID=3364924 RepID=UPI0036FEDC30
MLFDGTSALPAFLDADTEAAWEDGAARLGEAVSDRVVLPAVALLGAGTAVAAVIRLRRLADGTGAEDADSSA